MNLWRPSTLVLGAALGRTVVNALSHPLFYATQGPRTRPQQVHLFTSQSPIAMSGASTERGDALFGRFVIPSSSIFYRSQYTTAFVNLRPIVPGHVLVMSNRCVPRLSELTDDEYADVWHTVRRVQEILQVQQQSHSTIPSAQQPISFNVAIQDGVVAGQSVPHVHVHILPRHAGDYERNDDIYQDLEQWAPRDRTDARGTAPVEVPDVRRDRTVDEMADEAALYRRIVETSRL